MSRDGRDRRRDGGARDGGSTDVAGLRPGKKTLVEGAYPITGRPPLLVDREPIPPGGMLKTMFLVQLRQAVMAAADQEMAKGGASDACPYIEAYFAKYSGQPASALESVIGKWAPAAGGAKSATELIPLVAERVSAGVKTWKTTGALPADLAAADPGIAALAAASGAGGPPGSLASMEQQLGAGKPLDGGTASRMSSAVGVDVSGARIHSGPTASAMAAHHDATAFAVGQNVVLGGNAPAHGTIEMDVLLAHELAHTAQQKDAASDPVARKKPIGPEDEAAERDAGAERLARLGTFAGQVGDVMKTGLQLQRCPAKLPDGPPMEGKQADAAIASVDVIAQRITDDLKRGVNAESRTTFHQTKESFVKAWYDESILVRSVWKPNLTSEQLDKLRWQAARDQADSSAGFTNFETDVIHIYTKGTPAFVTIHELIHLHTNNTVYGVMGSNFVEGAADYYTDMACKKNNIPFAASYGPQYNAIKVLVAAIGEDAVADLVFVGAIDRAAKIVDSKGAGTWKKYKKALGDGNYAAAADLLAGVGAANTKREAAEEAATAAEQKKVDQKREAAEAKEREGWPPEGKKAVSARVISVSVVNGKGRAAIAHGASSGVREGWLARGKYKDGSPLEAKVVHVSSRTSQIEVANLEAANAIDGSVELRPPTSQ